MNVKTPEVCVLQDSVFHSEEKTSDSLHEERCAAWRWLAVYTASLCFQLPADILIKMWALPRDASSQTHPEELWLPRQSVSLGQTDVKTTWQWEGDVCEDL